MGCRSTDGKRFPVETDATRNSRGVWRKAAIVGISWAARAAAH
jgi:hypothetical protein